jgi:hypothetical protein
MRALLLVLLLSACAGVRGGNANSVIVKAGSDSEAFTLADRHCHQFGKSARLTDTRIAGSRYHFDCI